MSVSKFLTGSVYCSVYLLFCTRLTLLCIVVLYVVLRTVLRCTTVLKKETPFRCSVYKLYRRTTVKIPLELT